VLPPLVTLPAEEKRRLRDEIAAAVPVAA
jgi:hypothetical protein